MQTRHYFINIVLICIDLESRHLNIGNVHNSGFILLTCEGKRLLERSFLDISENSVNTR